MKNKIGYDFDEIGGNLEIVIVKHDCTALNNSSFLKSLALFGRFQQLPGQSWSFLDRPEQVEIVAKKASQELSTKAISFFFGDASEWIGYKLFVNGVLTEEYSFGPDYDAEMIEMGHDPSRNRKDGTVMATNTAAQQFLFWSQVRSQSEAEICGGEKFIDEFLRSQGAYLGWELFSQ